MASEPARDIGADPALDPIAEGGPRMGRRNGAGANLQILASDSAKRETGAPPPLSRLVPTSRLQRGRLQPRTAFGEEDLRALAESIRTRGILQPITVRPHPHRDGWFEVVAGERRWRAAQMAGIAEVPAVVRHISDREALALALIENVQRLSLTPIETAEGYRRLMEEFGYTQDDMARAVCKSRAQVANTLRLLALPETVRRLVQEGRLSAGHARALLGADDAPALAERVVAKGLSVRQTERLVRARAAAGQGDGTRAEGLDRKAAGPLVKDSRLAEMERELSSLLGMRVSVETGPLGRGGTLKVHFPTVADLEGVLRRLSEVAVAGKVKTKDRAVAARVQPVRTAHRPGARPLGPTGADMAANRNVDAYGPARAPGAQRDLEVIFPTPAL